MIIINLMLRMKLSYLKSILKTKYRMTIFCIKKSPYLKQTSY